MGNEASYPAEMCSHFDNDEIKRLGRSFKKLDLDKSGSLSVEEFMSLPELRHNPLVRRVIDVFDTNGNGEVDFKEFIRGVSQFSVKSNEEQKLRFAFSIYDMDKDGYISNGELFQVLKMIVGDNLKDWQLQQLVDKTIIILDRDGDGKISFEEFSAVVRDLEIHKKLVLIIDVETDNFISTAEVDAGYTSYADFENQIWGLVEKLRVLSFQEAFSPMEHSAQKSSHPNRSPPLGVLEPVEEAQQSVIMGQVAEEQDHWTENQTGLLCSCVNYQKLGAQETQETKTEASPQQHGQCHVDEPLSSFHVTRMQRQRATSRLLSTASEDLPSVATLQMGIKHFSGLFVLLCIGFGLSILTTIGEHIVYRLLLPRIKNKSKLQYWLHTSQRLHRALNTSFVEEKQKHFKAKRVEKRSNQDNLFKANGAISGFITELSPTPCPMRHVKEPQGGLESSVRPHQLTVWNTSNLSHDNQRKYIFSDEEGQNQLGIRTHQDIPLPSRRRELPASLTTNGKADSLNISRNSVMQELSELEKQIQVIRQELQLAVSRKTELEEYQRTSRTCES
ncbi:hypothetical protein P7K49_001468 [Saguinus oedipus]|uniref:EF-hand domain-containing protein n=1 Tax=Saguinus oedipus TaxID=9490 RepID=A0ABQ9WIG2_SAGOE|nr:hypothetical protein P7K49_001468 [Saguinus oedipus]